MSFLHFVPKLLFFFFMTEKGEEESGRVTLKMRESLETDIF